MTNVHFSGNNIPPIVAFGTKEATNYSSVKEHYDYISQMSIIPMFCGCDKKITKSAKNVGSWLFPKYKNETDDAKEK